MALTPKQRKSRQRYIGSSDLAALCGLDPWKNASDVWLNKTGRLLPSLEKDTGVQEIGHSFERGIIDLFAKKNGVKVKRNVFLTNEMFCSNLDGLITERNEIVEAKTTGKIEEWGPTGTDEIPERVLIQVHEQMYVVSHATGKECRIAWVPVLLPGYQNLEYRIYRIERNDALMESAIAIGVKFWTDHVTADLPPADFRPSMGLLKRVRREPESIVDVPDELVDEWLKADALAKEADKAADAAKLSLITAMRDAEGGRCSRGVLTYYQQHRNGYEVAPCDYRVLRKWKGFKSL